jgi:hypothetical protein
MQAAMVPPQVAQQHWKDIDLNATEMKKNMQLW